MKISNIVTQPRYAQRAKQICFLESRGHRSVKFALCTPLPLQTQPNVSATKVLFGEVTKKY